MHYRRKSQQRYLAARAVILHLKATKRAARKRRLRVSRPNPSRTKRRSRKYGWRKNLGHVGIQRIASEVSYGSNINHILSRDTKLKLGRYKSRFEKLVKIFRGVKVAPVRVIEVPELFSLTDSPKESFDFIYSLFAILYWETARELSLDYSKCAKIDLDAQVLMDVILSEFFTHHQKCRKAGKHVVIKRITPVNYEREHIVKILFSIGSFKLFTKARIDFPNIVPYDLCIGNKRMKGSQREISGQKGVHTTNLVDYVIECLARVKRRLTPEKRSDLCQVVGEILINAEEHSTTDNRFSIGYFEETTTKESGHFGMFNLVIFNFGQTIYEKFKDPACPTQHIVKRMKELSADYTKWGFFHQEFEEESLWTLYALQEGVTSKVNYQKRGNGSIRFIESFFSLKGKGLFRDDISRLSIHSGNTRIVFNGDYEIRERVIKNNQFKVITFNNAGDIEQPPDKKFVTFVPNYFPGTMIAATVKINESDLEKE